MKPNIEEINNSFTNKIWELKETDGEWGIYALEFPKPLFKITRNEVIADNADDNGNPLSSTVAISSELISVIKTVQDYLKSQQFQS